ncbi:glycogen debranching protein GlgX [Neomicrococcus aestuarii]|uniref:glycogen debranching protein GlgX n=1 Tax=Neomicrococcus aestuarii TaxID=556325 RepID=UPI000AF16739|nr:glycogen debranching protein GlgX [Neomicrococcus aestuarii]
MTSVARSLVHESTVGWPLGATLRDSGAHFAVAAPLASAAWLCLVDDDGRERQFPMRGSRDDSLGMVWHSDVVGVNPGQRYGYRVEGEWDPRNGSRFNPSKILVDPYARAISGVVTWDRSVFGFSLDSVSADSELLESGSRSERTMTLTPYEALEVPPEAGWVISDEDSLGQVPLSVVVDSTFDWGNDAPLRKPMHETVLYEAHVVGLTKTHPEIPEHLRGTYAALAHPAIIDHLQGLGVTALELMPVHHFVDDARLTSLGLSNYWGYNTLGFFAPHGGYAASGDTGQQVHEFKSMVKELHRNGIEVILDVVYNHTAETHRLGPQLSMRGIANQEYYHLDPNAPHEYVDFTGTGNSLNLESPLTQQLVLDSLAYWVDEMHVDGFRFDLAPVLARSNGYWRWDQRPRPRQVDIQDGLNLRNEFMEKLEAHPSLARTKLFAEPWDVGPDGYQLGNFSPRWAEWNGKYRDDVRDFWRGTAGMVGPLVSRVAGSADVFRQPGARPTNSVNFVTVHDGFTLQDLVSYEHKHNEANGEHNRDGADDNRSLNFGVEGPTDDLAIKAARLRQRKNLFLTLMVSQGVPLISHGDEVGRTQGGNNNAYCHNSPVSWIDWAQADSEFWAFARRAVQARTALAALRRRRFFEGTAAAAVDGDLQPDVVWMDRDGDAMQHDDWNDAWQHSIVYVLNGSADACGLHGNSRDVLVMLNASADAVTYVAPPNEADRGWELLISSAEPHEFVDFPGANWDGQSVTVPARSATIFVANVR